MDWIFVCPPHFTCWSSNSQCNGIWTWSLWEGWMGSWRWYSHAGISALIRGNTKELFSLHTHTPRKTMWAHSEKAAVCKPGKELFLDTKLCWTLILDVPVSRTVRNLTSAVYTTQYVLFCNGRASRLIQKKTKQVEKGRKVHLKRQADNIQYAHMHLIELLCESADISSINSARKHVIAKYIVYWLSFSHLRIEVLLKCFCQLAKTINSQVKPSKGAGKTNVHFFCSSTVTVLRIFLDI